MSQRIKANRSSARRRKITYLWVFGLAVLTFFLIYKEQTALLYILATLGVTALLIVVAVADLEGRDRVTGVAQGDSGSTPFSTEPKRRFGD